MRGVFHEMSPFKMPYMNRFILTLDQPDNNDFLLKISAPASRVTA